MLGSKPATRPPILVDSFDSCVNNSSDNQKSDDDRDSSSESASNNKQSLDLSTEKSPSDGSSPGDLSSDQVEEHDNKKPLGKRRGHEMKRLRRQWEH